MAAAIALCQHILTVPRSAKWVTFTTERHLNAAGFVLRLSEPPLQHYDVILGHELASADLAKLATVFNQYDRRRFPSCSL